MMPMCRVQELGTDPQKLPQKGKDLLPGKGRGKERLASTMLRDNECVHAQKLPEVSGSAWKLTSSLLGALCFLALLTPSVIAYSGIMIVEEW